MRSKSLALSAPWGTTPKNERDGETGCSPRAGVAASSNSPATASASQRRRGARVATLLPLQLVVARSAAEPVPTLAADQAVAAGAAADHIVAATPEDDVVATQTDDHVAAPGADQPLAVAGADDRRPLAGAARGAVATEVADEEGFRGWAGADAAPHRAQDHERAPALQAGGDHSRGTAQPQLIEGAARERHIGTAIGKAPHHSQAS